MINKFTLLFFCLSAFLPYCNYAQKAFEANDSVTLGASYANDVYYSFEKGIQKSVLRTEWDLAFMVNASSSILVNTPEQRMLYKLPFSVEEWEKVDTAGNIKNENRLVNSSQSWYAGAFNRTTTGGASDIGWANYDFFTHSLKGDSLYALLLPGKVWKKLMIEGREQGVYTFRFANLDGSEEVRKTIDTKDYRGQLFIYFSVLQNRLWGADREPQPENWDLLFGKYMYEYEGIPISEDNKFYPVTGALLNPALEAAKVVTTSPKDAKWQEATFTEQADVIGYDWKNFDTQTMQWQLAYNNVYFVKDHKKSVWRLYFTDFLGSRTGKILFHKEKVGDITSRENQKGSAISYSQLYPNPTKENTHFIFETQEVISNAKIEIYTLTGQKVRELTLQPLPGLNQIALDIKDLEPSMYHILLKNGSSVLVSHKLVVAR
jgi:hypothetical protein